MKQKTQCKLDASIELSIYPLQTNELWSFKKTKKNKSQHGFKLQYLRINIELYSYTIHKQYYLNYEKNSNQPRTDNSPLLMKPC